MLRTTLCLLCLLVMSLVATQLAVAVDSECPISVSVCTTEELEAIPLSSITNKLWSSTLTPSGYSDLTIRGVAPFPKRDPRTPGGPEPLHEWLSGEFGIAVLIDGVGPIWTEPCFRYPEWKTNSDFTITQAIQSIGDPDLDGLDEADSIVANPNLQIKTTYDMEIVQSGVAMGRGSLAGDAFRLSGPYALKFTYELMNIGPSTITDLRLYQFAAMHPANSETPIVDIVYDSALHATGDFQNFRYDLTATAWNSGLRDNFPTGSMFLDHVNVSASMAPSAWGLGSYRGHNPGDPGLPLSGGFKPVVGEHCDIENKALANETSLLQDEAAGSMRFDLGVLMPGEIATVEILFTAHSEAHGLPADACLRVVDDTGPDPVISLEKGACAPAAAGGPYDVIMGSLYDLQLSPGCNPSFDCSVIIDAQCIAKGHAFDRIDVDEDAHELDSLYYLARNTGSFTSWGDGLGPIGSMPLSRFFFTYQGASGVDVCDTIP